MQLKPKFAAWYREYAVSKTTLREFGLAVDISDEDAEKSVKDRSSGDQVSIVRVKSLGERHFEQ